MSRTFTLTLPVSVESLGQWLEEHNVTIDIACMLGQYHVTCSRKKLLSYSDERGQHAETWSVSRQGKTFAATLASCLQATGLPLPETT